MESNAAAYRVTIRYHEDGQQYEIFELHAADLREALGRTADRFPRDAVATADLIEIRRARPASGG